MIARLKPKSKNCLQIIYKFLQENGSPLPDCRFWGCNNTGLDSAAHRRVGQVRAERVGVHRNPDLLILAAHLGLDQI